jgi:leucyl-tRNA---protein transferase
MLEHHQIINQRAHMQVLPVRVFDRIMAEGWRALGYALIRHNIVVEATRTLRTIPVRIGLTSVEFSSSQRKLLRKVSAGFAVEVKPIATTPEHAELFLLHCDRFGPTRGGYDSIETFIGINAHYMPVSGYMIEVRDAGRLVACSYFHIGHQTVCGTYCIFDPAYSKHSLGHFTMLRELQIGHSMGMEWYYPGYVYDQPSQFDYKLNFEHLEVFDWLTSTWEPRSRVVPVPREER